MLSSWNPHQTEVLAFSLRSTLISLHTDRLDKARAAEPFGSLPTSGDLGSSVETAGRIHGKFISDPQVNSDMNSSEEASDLQFDFDVEKEASRPTPYRLPPREMSQKHFVIPNEDDDSSEEETTTMMMKKKKQQGNKREHTIANSKLLSLLTTLDGRSSSFDDGAKMMVGSVPAAATTNSFARKEVKTSADFNFLRGSEGCVSGGGCMKRSESAPSLGDCELNIAFTVSNNVAEVPEQTQVQLEVLDDSEEDKQNRSKYKRSSSLKSGKTPPGTPGAKKIVRFADLFGLDLIDVKMFINEVPKVPKSAFMDLPNAELSDMDSDSSSAATTSSYSNGRKSKLSARASKSAPPRLKPLFAQPSGTPTMYNNLRDKKVSLENAFVCHDSGIIKGMVSVANLAFDKKVLVRYTTDEWKSHRDVICTYVDGTCDGFADKFSFALDCSGVMGKVGKRLQFCVSFYCLGNVYWDSNNGGNYVFQFFAGGPNRPVEFGGGSRRSPSPSDSIGVPSSAGGGGLRAHTFSQLSNSPTTLNDDPWLQYL